MTLIISTRKCVHGSQGYVTLNLHIHYACGIGRDTILSEPFCLKLVVTGRGLGKDLINGSGQIFAMLTQFSCRIHSTSGSSW